MRSISLVFRRGPAPLFVWPVAAAVVAALPLSLPGPVMPPDAAFTPWFESRGVSVEIARQPSGPAWIRGRGTISAPAAKVAATLSDFEHYRDLFAPGVRQANVLERESPSSARLHFVWPYPFPYMNRDAVVRYEALPRPEGGFRIAWHSAPGPKDPKEGTRIERVVGETVIEPDVPEKCRVVYTYFGDLGGKFPAWAEEKAWREEPVQYFRAICRRLGLPDLEKGDR